ncbi:MAG: TraC family protein, partial [Sulfurimonas sp.]
MGEFAILGIGLATISIITAALISTIKDKEENDLSTDEWKPIYERERIIKYLPYEDFLEDDGLYVTKDGGIGLVIECQPFPLVGTKTHTSIKSLLDILPEDANIQFSLFSGADIVDQISGWRNGKNTEGTLEKDIVNSYDKFLNSKRYEGISRNFSAPIRNVRLVISVKLGGKEKKQGIFGGESFMSMFSSGSSEMDDFKVKKIQMIAIKDRAIGILNASGFGAEICHPDTLIRIVYSLINQGHSFEDIPKWDGSTIANFMVSNDTKIEINEDFIKMDGIVGKSMATKSYPDKWALLGVIDYVGSIFRDDNFTAPFIITLNASKLRDFEKTRIKGNAGIVMSQQMPYALFPRLKHKHQDLAYGMEKLEKGEDLYYTAFNMFIFAKNEENLLEATGQVQTYYRGLGFKLEEDKYVNFPAFLTNLPLGFDMQMQDFLGKERGRVIFGENVADLAPVSSDWKGNGQEVPLVSPRGQLMGFDLFANATGGFNSFVIGMTGSGKSVFLQWLLENYYLSNNQIWIIDIGRSYEKFTHAY